MEEFWKPRFSEEKRGFCFSTLEGQRHFEENGLLNKVFALGVQSVVEILENITKLMPTF